MIRGKHGRKDKETLDMSNPIYKKINITNLLLNPSNPRFNPVEHQSEAFDAMIRDQLDKLVVLARHVSLYGLNPSDLILVKPYKKQWVVREGNRRVAALKLVNEPSLIPSDFPKLKKEFQQLSLTIDKELLENIQCVVLESEDEINEWVRLKHTGQNEGAGTVSWDGQQTSRFRTIAEGRPDMRLTFLDDLQRMEGVPQYIKDRLGDIKKTNFDRLIGDPDIRNIMGLEIVDNKLQLVDGINPFLLMVLNDLVYEDLSVGTIYLKKDRIKYIESLKGRLKKDNSAIADRQNFEESNATGDINKGHSIGYYSHKPPNWDYSGNGATKDEQHFSSMTKAASNSDNYQKKATSYYINRKTLVPSPHKLTITHPRILKIFNELKSLVIDDYPNSVAVLFRVFIELSIDCFITRKGLVNSKLNIDSKLSHKIDAVASYFEINKIMTKHGLRAIRQMTAGENQTQSVRTFHSYVHNKDVTPSSADLKSAWDDIWPFIEQMWR